MALFAGVAGTVPPRRPAAALPAPVGRKVADFTLRDTRGREWSLRAVADKKLVVVAFLGADCPLANLYGPRLAELAGTFGPRGVAFVGINANAQDSLADTRAYARRHRLPFPLLKDPDQAVSDRLGAVRTPEVFVLDEGRVVRYWGRIDDRYEVGGVRRPRAGRRHLAAALEELLAGRPVTRPAVPSVGCHIGREPRARPRGRVTYAGQVGPIVQRRCAGCHRAGGVAPFPLTEPADVVRWSAMIREVVDQGRMPPWFADPRHGRFRNDARLAAAEKRLLLGWIDDGCPLGDLSRLPGPSASPGGWRIGRPDRVLAMADRPFTVPAEGEVEYQYFLVDPGFTEDRWVRAAEVLPGNAAVVHHALVALVPPDGDATRLDPAGALLDYAPGMAPAVLSEGYALRVPAGSKFLFQLHYTPNGSGQTDLTRLGLVFADPRDVRHEVRGGAVINTALVIPPGAARHRVVAELVLEEDVDLLSLSPHMHLRGRSFRFEAVLPGGGREILLDVPRYDFNWQLRYELAEPRRLPRGTRLVCTAVYDNSAGNPANPDPTQTVRWGDQTREEMLIGFFTFVRAGDPVSSPLPRGERGERGHAHRASSGAGSERSVSNRSGRARASSSSECQPVATAATLAPMARAHCTSSGVSPMTQTRSGRARPLRWACTAASASRATSSRSQCWSPKPPNVK
jgi:peroxiredoxin